MIINKNVSLPGTNNERELPKKCSGRGIQLSALFPFMISGEGAVFLVVSRRFVFGPCLWLFIRSFEVNSISPVDVRRRFNLVQTIYE